MIAAIFLFPVKKEKTINTNIKTTEQTIPEALKEALSHKGFIHILFASL